MYKKTCLILLSTLTALQVYAKEIASEIKPNEEQIILEQHFTTKTSENKTISSPMELDEFSNNKKGSIQVEEKPRPYNKSFIRPIGNIDHLIINPNDFSSSVKIKNTVNMGTITVKNEGSSLTINSSNINNSAVIGNIDIIDHGGINVGNSGVKLKVNKINISSD